MGQPREPLTCHRPRGTAAPRRTPRQRGDPPTSLGGGRHGGFAPYPPAGAASGMKGAAGASRVSPHPWHSPAPPRPRPREVILAGLSPGTHVRARGGGPSPGSHAGWFEAAGVCPVPAPILIQTSLILVPFQSIRNRFKLNANKPLKPQRGLRQRSGGSARGRGCSGQPNGTRVPRRPVPGLPGDLGRVTLGGGQAL